MQSLEISVYRLAATYRKTHISATYRKTHIFLPFLLSFQLYEKQILSQNEFHPPNKVQNF